MARWPLRKRASPCVATRPGSSSSLLRAPHDSIPFELDGRWRERPVLRLITLRSAGRAAFPEHTVLPTSGCLRLICQAHAKTGNGTTTLVAPQPGGARVAINEARARAKADTLVVHVAFCVAALACLRARSPLFVLCARRCACPLSCHSPRSEAKVERTSPRPRH